MAWRPDRLLAGFEALELPAPDDYDGRVVATLVRLPVPEAPIGAVRGTVLYVHGFIDYFFQRHMAERFPIVKALHDRSAFTAIRVEMDTVVWENGFDLAPEFLRAMAKPRVPA